MKRSKLTVVVILTTAILLEFLLGACSTPLALAGKSYIALFQIGDAVFAQQASGAVERISPDAGAAPDPMKLPASNGKAIVTGDDYLHINAKQPVFIT